MKLVSRIGAGFFGMMVMLSACGADSNVNKFIFSNQGDDEEFEPLVERAQLLYDQGDMDKAAELAQKAIVVEPTNEKARILMGYISLSQAGVDPFIIADRLIALSKTDAEDDGSTCSSLSSSGGGGSAASTLTAMSCLLNLSDTDYEKMGSFEDSEDVPSIFANYPVLLPNSPGYLFNEETGETDPDSMRSQVGTLYYLNKAIEFVCPFVNHSATGVIYSDDARHNCTEVTYHRHLTTKAHLVWGLAHLIEALAFNTILLYEGDGSTTLAESSSGGFSSNLLNRVTALNNANEFSSLSEYANTLTTLKSNVDTVFKLPEGDESAGASMLQSTLINLKTTSGAFGAISGMPDSMTKSIEEVITKIEEIAGKLQDSGSGSESELDKQSRALQGQFNEKAVTQMEESIEEYTSQVNEEDISEQEKTEICDAYSAFSDGVDPTKTNTPTLCK